MAGMPDDSRQSGILDPPCLDTHSHSGALLPTGSKDMMLDSSNFATLISFSFQECYL